MFTTQKYTVPEAELQVQKVKKIEPVYNLVTRPMVYANNPKMVTRTVKERPAAYLVDPCKRRIERMLSAQDIDSYIDRKKQQFNQGDDTHQYVQKQL